jgi:hypothetical protein
MSRYVPSMDNSSANNDFSHVSRKELAWQATTLEDERCRVLPGHGARLLMTKGQRVEKG